MPSSLLPHLQKYLRSSPQTPSRQVMRSPSYDEQAGFDAVESKFSEATLLEAPMQAFDIPSCTVSENGFTHFMDGIQRSYLLYYQNYVPVYYGYTAAVVRQRQKALLSKWQHQVREALYLPFVEFDSEELNRLRSQQLPLVDTLKLLNSPKVTSGEEASESQLQVMQECQNARNAITLTRERLEAELAETWIQSQTMGWLVMDGSITISPESSQHPRIVGLIKSHNTQYFRFPDQQVILNLRQGQRSSAFIPRGRHPVCSWYLRLRDNTNQDLYFGLIRVEAALQSSMELQKQECDRLSAWIMTERRPLSLPDSRWDKMIYPIRDCEQFLRSQEPSKASFA
ncbi:hypothetical protein Syn7502_00887 [Synechococcus sp. PCC 7502]|uniref:hypothetical protein n=1 Tax=Synechococcus sp. PCC 7502 TaxID=1173263 RepID=UPI00029FE40E|nr:hypothetical protein [Synechococcus sp. PCC 7502]AFY73010.1 hypothetical protein Syn7502_00887 [Synechococcus sp. PCC 7502]